MKVYNLVKTLILFSCFEPTAYGLLPEVPNSLGGMDPT